MVRTVLYLRLFLDLGVMSRVKGRSRSMMKLTLGWHTNLKAMAVAGNTSLRVPILKY